MNIGFPVCETIQRRFSVRGYDGNGLSGEQKERIAAYLETLDNPLGPKARIRLLERGAAAGGEKLGTYGVIKGARVYFGAAMEPSEQAPEALGYQVEQLVLYLASLGLGTCWLGGTFNKGSFAAAMELGEGELLPIVSPVGVPAEKKRLLEHIMASGTKRHSRMDWDKLFFEGDFGTPLTPQAAGDCRTALEMVRLAPSAVNKQPWRVVKQGNTFHFFEQHSLPGAGVDLQRIDVGIALCHFHLTAVEQGLHGRFERVEHGLTLSGGMDYITSWIEE